MAKNSNLDKKFDELIGVLKSVSLTDTERLNIKESLLNFANDSIVRNSAPSRLIYTRSLLTNIFIKRMPIALLIAMFFGGGVSFAAESSLPGNFLYPVKTEVNERVGEVLAFSAEAKAEYEAKLLNKRAEEMEKLAEKGEMTPERVEKLKAKFEIHAEKARERFSKLEASGKLESAIEANSDLQTNLKARIEAIMDISERDGDESKKAELRKWLMDIKDEDGRFGDIRLKMENKLKLDVSADVEARAEGKLNAVQNKIEEAAKFIANHKDSVNADVSAKAEAQLTVAKGIMAEGKVKLEAKEYGQAFVLFHKAHVSAMEAKRIIIVGEKIKLLNKIEAEVKLNRERKEEVKEEREERKAERESSSVSAEGRAEAESDNSETRANAKIRIGI